MKEITRQYHSDPAADEIDGIEKLVREGATVIPVKTPGIYEHPDYAPSFVEIDGSKKHFLIRQRAAISVDMNGSDDPDIGLEETTKAYVEYKKRVEEPNILGGKTDICDSVVGEKIESAHRNYLVTKLVKPGKDRDSEVYIDEKVIAELGLDDLYVSDRLRAIAASALDKTAAELVDSGENLIGIIEHIDRDVENVERLSGREFEKIFCYAYSHWKIRDDYERDEGEMLVADSSFSDCKTGKRITKETKTVHRFRPDIKKYEDEIVEFLGDKAHSDIRNLIRTYINLKFILPEDKSRALAVYPNEETYKRIKDAGDKAEQ